MKKIKKSKRKLNTIGALLIASMTLSFTGCSLVDRETTPVETSLGKINTVDYENEEYVLFDDLEDSKAYLVYHTDKDNVYYDVEFLKERVTDDYTAYYGTRDGKLVSLDINDPQVGDSYTYKGYLANDVKEIGDVKSELFNSDLNKMVTQGIDYENETITYDALVLMELSYISRYPDEVHEYVEEIRETGLKK